MSIFNSIAFQGALLSAAAVGLMILSVWWFYLSPLKGPKVTANRPSTRLAGWLAGLLGLAALLWIAGALWDASLHIKTGEVPGGSDFLWPPHLMLYSGFMLAFLVAVIAIALVAIPGWRTGRRDARRWVRQNPYLGAVALASLYELLAIPSDAIWHELFGEDLTAWSPPHVLLGVMSAIVILCAVGVLLQSRIAASKLPLRDAAIISLLSFMLNVIYIIGVLEWELPVRSPQVDARPLWYYPLVGGGLAFFVLALARRLANTRWAATYTTLAFYFIRLPITGILGLTDNVAPTLPLIFILGAFLMDVLPWKQIPSRIGRALGIAVAFTAGYGVLAFPILALHPNLHGFDGVTATLSLLTSLMASLGLLPLANLTGRKLVGVVSEEIS